MHALQSNLCNASLLISSRQLQQNARKDIKEKVKASQAALTAKIDKEEAKLAGRG